MPAITLSLTREELTEAIGDYVRKQGFEVTDRLSVSVRQIPGDRPFDGDYTETTVTGVVAKEARHDS